MGDLDVGKEWGGGCEGEMGKGENGLRGIFGEGVEGGGEYDVECDFEGDFERDFESVSGVVS